MDTEQEATAGTDTRAAPIPSDYQGYMEVKNMSIQDMNATAKDLMSVRAMIRELEAEAEALTDKLKAAMVERSTETLEGDGWRASWKNIESRRFDSKAFKAQHGDLYEAFTKATTTTRFVISA